MKILVGLFLLAAPVSAADARDTEVQRVMTRFLTAFQDLNWPDFRECWTENPILITPGPGPSGDVRRVDTPADFEAVWQDQFRRIQEGAAKRGVTKPPYMNLVPKDLRIDYPGPTVADVTFHLSGASPSVGRRMFVLALNVGGWRITHLHASNVTLQKKE